jgi:hypothetical protein
LTTPAAKRLATELVETLDLAADAASAPASRPDSQVTMDAPPDPAPAAPPGALTPSTTHTTTSLDVMHRQEIERARVFTRVAFALAMFVLLLSFFLSGDPVAKGAMATGMLGVGVTTACLGWQLRTDAGYSLKQTIAVGHVAMLRSFTAVYYFGAFSPAPIILPFGLFFFSSSHSARATFAL